jgi:hypothetical protein
VMIVYHTTKTKARGPKITDRELNCFAFLS